MQHFQNDQKCVDGDLKSHIKQTNNVVVLTYTSAHQHECFICVKVSNFIKSFLYGSCPNLQGTKTDTNAEMRLKISYIRFLAHLSYAQDELL